jgi:hypothetical protein
VVSIFIEKEFQMKRIYDLLFSIIFAAMLALAGCGGGGGGGDSPDNDVTDTDEVGPEDVQNLQSFEGQFVSSETEATTLASGADIQIQSAIAQALTHTGQALAQVQPTENPSANTLAAERSGHYEYNGVVMDYTVSGDILSQTYPYSYNIAEIVTINGTYGGYKINGSYNLHLNYIWTSATAYSVKYDYDSVYTVSHDGKGMKVIQSGDMTMTYNQSSYSYSYNLHYAVYDNNNIRRFNYDYDYSQ